MKFRKFKNALFACALFFGAIGATATATAGEINIAEELIQQYKGSTKDMRLIMAAETLKGTIGDYSRRAILGDNLSGKPMKMEFRDLATLNPAYASFDALGWKNKGRLNIYINIKHQNAPKEAIAAVLAHEALHQDELNSINEETYAWTLEAAVWTELTDDNPAVADVNSALVDRENTIKKLFVKGNYTNKFIRKSVISNVGYQNLPSRSPGFEDEGNL